MFAGIIEKKGKLVRRTEQKRSLTLTFESTAWEKPLKRGESIAVNGVCLTVTKIPNPKQFVVDVVRDTLKSTALKDLKLKESVNLERSLTWGERISGHFVLGHVDGVGTIVKKTLRGKNLSLTIDVSSRIMQHFVPKGSVAVDGVSLTIQNMKEHTIEIAIIPHTAKMTTLGAKKVKDQVHLEADVIGKHLAKWVQGTNPEALTVSSN